MPRAGLNKPQVVAAAAAAADEAGFTQLTLAMVAKRLGVRIPSLYNHVENLEALRREIAILSLGELAARLSAAAAGRARREALHATADAYRQYALDHPGRHAATVRAPQRDDETHNAAAAAVVDVVLAVLRGYHLDGDDAVDAVRSLRAALHGWAELEKSGGFGMPQDVGRSYRRFVDGFDAALAAQSPSSREHPTPEPQGALP